MQSLFLISNLTEAVLLIVVALILLSVRSRNDFGMRYYQRAKRWLSLCIFVTGVSFLSELVVGGVGGQVEILDIYNQAFFFITNVSGQLAFIHLYNSRQLGGRTLAWIFAPVVVLLGIYAVLVIALGPAPEVFTSDNFLALLPTSPVLIFRVLILLAILVGLAMNLLRYFQARRAYRAMLDNYFSDDREWRRTKWIDAFLYCGLVLVISTVLSYLVDFGWYDLVFQLIMTMGMLFLAIRLINYQGQFPDVALAVEFAQAETSSASIVVDGKLFCDTIAAQRVSEWMQNPSKQYLLPGLTLSDVSRTMGLSPHRLSAYLNIIKGTNFNRWIASLRIREVEARLRDPKCTETLSEIGCDTGFADLAAMSNAFKKIIGESPSTYRKRFHA